MDLSSVVLTSIVVSAGVSGAFTLIGQLVNQCLASKARQRELVFNAAIDLAKERRKLLIETAKEQDRNLDLLPDVYTTADIYVSLNHIFEKGRLDNYTRESIDAQQKIIDSFHKQGIYDQKTIFLEIAKATEERKRLQKNKWFVWWKGK